MDVSGRNAVRLALSELFLDIDVAEHVPMITDVLRASGQSLQTLELIMLDEIYPVCHWNLRQVAGEWTGFNPVWLAAQCDRAAAQGEWRKAIYRPVRRLGLRRLVPEWKTVKDNLASNP